MKTAIVPATAEMLKNFYGKPPSRSMRAFAGMADGQVLAIFGVYHDENRMVLFSDIKPEARKFKKSLVQGAFTVMGTIQALGLPVHAVADCVEGSTRLLKRMGFHEKNGVWVWPV